MPASHSLGDTGNCSIRGNYSNIRGDHNMARKHIKLALEAYDMQGNRTNDIRPGERAFLKLPNGRCVLTSPVQSVKMWSIVRIVRIETKNSVYHMKAQ